MVSWVCLSLLADLFRLGGRFEFVLGPDPVAIAIQLFEMLREFRHGGAGASVDEIFQGHATVFVLVAQIEELQQFLAVSIAAVRGFGFG